MDKIYGKEVCRMVVMSKIYDNRINSCNLYVETTFGEYLSFARDIIKNNELQRKRVRASKSVYSLLKNDLKRGCVMPPLVLAIAGNKDINLEKENDKIAKDVINKIKNDCKDILILDGLQRTYTLIDASAEMEQESPEDYQIFLNHKLRLEIYVDINKFGVLYRMLTLNTGQTPMAARHQLEMLYRDKLNTSIEGVKLITDVQGKADPEDNEFIFKNVIDGFNSYMNRNELPIDRQELLENIQMLENMSDEDVANDIFEEFLGIYVKVFNKLCYVSNNYYLTDEDKNTYEISDSPFGKSVSKVFSTSQAMTGFGAAIGRMKDNGTIKEIDEIEKMLEKLEDNTNEWFLEMLVKFDKIKQTSKKIGNGQRMFIQYFFRELFNKESDSYLNLYAAVNNGYQKYYSQV